jgi:hypothetical protein
MTEPKKPQDRKPPKTDAPKVTETDAGWDVTHRGISLTVVKESLDDFELLDALASIQRDEKRNAHLIPFLLRRIAGDDGFRAVTDGMRGENGRVPIAETTQFVMEVFSALSPNS